MTISKLNLILILLFILTIGGCKKRDSSKHEPEKYAGPEIHQMAIQGNFEAVKSMIVQNSALIHIQDKHGNTPLHLASYHSRTGIVTLLIKHGADVNARNNFGGTALLSASYAGCKDVVLILIEHGANVNTSIKDGAYGKHVTTLEGYRDYRHMYSAKGGIINVKVHFANSPLQAAAANSHKEIAELLIANDADVNAIMSKTALHSAAVNGHAELVMLLIANGADVNARSSFGLTPLASAMRLRGSVDRIAIKNTAEVLIEEGANVNSKTTNGMTPLHYAAGFGTKEIVELLISSGAEINARTNAGDTPLNVACRYKRKKRGGVIDLLHKHGAVRRHGKNHSYDYEPDLIGLF